MLRPGDLISGFMKRIGLADHVIVVLSDKYLRSPYCMTELHSIYQRSVGEKEDFLRRIIPLRIGRRTIRHTGRTGRIREALGGKISEVEVDLDHLSVEDFRLYKSMQKWHLDSATCSPMSTTFSPRMGLTRL